MVISINGKVRDKMIVENKATSPEIEELALKQEKIMSYIDGKKVVKIIVVPGKLVNIVVK